MITDVARNTARAESAARALAVEQARLAGFEAKGRADYERFSWTVPAGYTPEERDAWWRGRDAGFVAWGGRLARRTV